MDHSQDLRIRFKGEDSLSEKYYKLAEELTKQVEDGRELFIALERLEESFMWALKGEKE